MKKVYSILVSSILFLAVNNIYADTTVNFVNQTNNEYQCWNCGELGNWKITGFGTIVIPPKGTNGFAQVIISPPSNPEAYMAITLIYRDATDYDHLIEIGFTFNYGQLKEAPSCSVVDDPSVTCKVKNFPSNTTVVFSQKQ